MSVESSIFFRQRIDASLSSTVIFFWDPESDHKRVWVTRKLSSDRKERSSLQTSSGRGISVLECPITFIKWNGGLLDKRRNVVNMLSLLFHQRLAVWWRTSCSSLLRCHTKETSVRVCILSSNILQIKKQGVAVYTTTTDIPLLHSYEYWVARL